MSLLLLLSFFGPAIQAQNGINTSGGQASGGGGAVSYSVGQLVYHSYSGPNGSVSQGMQQPHITSPPAGIDLQVLKIVNDPTPDKNDHVVFTITLTNNDLTLHATNINIIDNLSSDFRYVTHSSTIGTSFTASTDTWLIPDIGPGNSVKLYITAEVLASGDNTASISSFDQTDPNHSNNLGYTALTINGSSGGNTGGVESEGSMAGDMAIRNFERLKINKTRHYNEYQNLQSFREFDIRNGLLLPASRMKSKSTNLLSFIPENGPAGTKAHIVTPEDLLLRTNAVEVFSVDYFRPDNRRLATIMAMTTPNGEAYNHTKMVCDRLTGATLRKIEQVSIKNYPFIRGMLVQENGEIDYAISFIVYESGGTFVVDNQWLNNEYAISTRSEVFNFQVWSALPEESNKLVEEILNRLDADKGFILNKALSQRIPQVYVTQGRYQDGQMVLDIMNLISASSITLSGTLTRTENGEREHFSQTVSIDPNTIYNEEIAVSLGYIFDVGFTVENDLHQDKDLLYFADGPWGKYTEENSAIIKEFAVHPHSGASNPAAYILERDASLSGQVKSYASLFKSLIVGNRPVNLSEYNQLEFKGSGDAVVEVIVAVKNIDTWSKQARKTIHLEPEEKAFTINYRELSSFDPTFSFNGQEVVSVVFNAVGDGMNYTDFDMNISQLKFSKGSSDPGSNLFYNLGAYNYPNPFTAQTTISFQLAKTGKVRIVLCDISGQEISIITEGYFNYGKNQVIYNTGNQSSGNYLYKIITESVVVMGKMTIIN